MTIALWLLRALRFLRPYLPLIAGILILAGLLSAYGHREYQRGAHSRDKEVSALTAQRDAYRANQAALTDALNRQNAAVAALKADSEKRTAVGRKALSEAQRANQGLQDQAAALRKSAGRKVDATSCPISETLQKAGAV